MCVSSSWLKQKEPFPLLLCIYVLFYTNVAEGGSSLDPTTLDLSLGLDSSAVHENVQITAKTEPKSDKKLSWISQVLMEKLSNFRPKSETNQLCNQQSDLYERSLQNLTLWAVQMREASAGATPGMVVGQRFQLGHFDECVAVQNPSVTGRYCLVNIKFAPSPESYPDFYLGESNGQNTPPYSTAWDAFKKSKTAMHDKNDIWWGVCVPAACTGQDVDNSLSKAFADVQERHGILLDIRIHDQVCFSSADDAPFPTTTKITIYTVVSLSVLSILATLYHTSTWNVPNLEERGGLVHKIMVSFSMSTSFDSLTCGAGKMNMNVLDTLKFLSTVQNLMLHRIIAIMAWALFNPSFFQSEKKNDGLLFMPTLIIETFFVISGFLMYATYYSPLQKHGIKILPLMIFNRWLRLMPSYLTFIAFYVFLLPYMGNGPGWTHLTKNTINDCRERWWLNVLGLNNFFIKSDSLSCGIHTWYLSCDLQLVPVGLLLVYMFARSHSAGLKFSLTSLFVAIVIPFSIIYFNSYNGVFTAEDRSNPNNPNRPYFSYIYTQSYSRAGPYIISIISAFLFFKIRENKWILSVTSRWIVLLVAIGVGLGSQFYGKVFYDKTRERNSLEHALFGALHRSLWSLMICAFVVSQLAWGFGGIVDKLLTHRMFVPLSRLAYIVYLFHPIWLTMTAASSRTPSFLSIWNIILMLAGDFLVVYGAALWLYCIIEGPTSHLRAIFIGKITKIGYSGKVQESKQVD